MLSIKEILEGLAVAENQGDISDYIKILCKTVGFKEPLWHQGKHHMVFEWEDDFYAEASTQ